MDINATDGIFGIIVTAIFGILKHIYSKFQKIDDVNKEQDDRIGIMNGEIKQLIQQGEDRKNDIKEIKDDIKETKTDIRKILVKLGVE